MNKSELVATIVEKTGSTKKDAEMIMNATFEAISDALAKGDKVSLIGFGNFEVRERAAREGKNPQTGEKIQISEDRWLFTVRGSYCLMLRIYEMYSSTFARYSRVGSSPKLSRHQLKNKLIFLQYVLMVFFNLPLSFKYSENSSVILIRSFLLCLL